jgi:AcrR family transcriptional regulator
MAAAEDRPPASPRGARTVTRILDSAARLFGRDGYRGATMHAVAEAAGVSKGLLHYHFRSKEHLLIEAQRATFRQVHRRIDERVHRGDLGMATALEGLDAIWGAVREMRSWAPFMVETMSLSSSDVPIRERLDAFYVESEGLLVEAIERIFRAESDSLTLPPERLARLVRITLHGLIIELAYARNDAELARVDEAYRDLRDVFVRIAVNTGRA